MTSINQAWKNKSMSLLFPPLHLQLYMPFAWLSALNMINLALSSSREWLDWFLFLSTGNLHGFDHWFLSSTQSVDEEWKSSSLHASPLIWWQVSFFLFLIHHSINVSWLIFGGAFKAFKVFFFCQHFLLLPRFHRLTTFTVFQLNNIREQHFYNNFIIILSW